MRISGPRMCRSPSEKIRGKRSAVIRKSIRAELSNQISVPERNILIYLGLPTIFQVEVGLKWFYPEWGMDVRSRVVCLIEEIFHCVRLSVFIFEEEIPPFYSMPIWCCLDLFIKWGQCWRTLKLHSQLVHGKHTTFHSP